MAKLEDMADFRRDAQHAQKMGYAAIAEYQTLLQRVARCTGADKNLAAKIELAIRIKRAKTELRELAEFVDRF